MNEQIEEMGKLCPFYEEGKCDLLEATRCNFDCDMCDFAKTLYNANYRKQIKAEWKSGKTINGAWGYSCTNCGAAFVGENAEWIAKEHDYCPKCGAKMKGGAE